MDSRTESGDDEACGSCEPDAVGGATGGLAALLASSCCWVPALAALAGFSAVGTGVIMMNYHTSLALLALGLLGLAWYLFVRKRYNGPVAWNSGYVHWTILIGSTAIVLLYSVIGWVFPSVFLYIT